MVGALLAIGSFTEGYTFHGPYVGPAEARAELRANRGGEHLGEVLELLDPVAYLRDQVGARTEDVAVAAQGVGELEDEDGCFIAVTGEVTQGLTCFGPFNNAAAATWFAENFGGEPWFTGLVHP
jgi:hypothetical protein